MYPERFYEPFTTLAWLAARTTRIQLGTTVVIVPYRHPLLIERMTAQLQDFSGGRLVLGVGVGWARQEFAALGVPFERRGRLTDAFLASLPKEHPPIWVGGHSEAAIRRAGQFGDAWHPLNASLEWLAGEALPQLKEFAAKPVAGACLRAAHPGAHRPPGGSRPSPRPGQPGRDPSRPGGPGRAGRRIRDSGHVPGRAGVTPRPGGPSRTHRAAVGAGHRRARRIITLKARASMNWRRLKCQPEPSATPPRRNGRLVRAWRSRSDVVTQSRTPIKRCLVSVPPDPTDPARAGLRCEMGFDRAE